MLAHAWPFFLVIVLVFGGAAVRFVMSLFSSFSRGAIAEVVNEAVVRAERSRLQGAIVVGDAAPENFDASARSMIDALKIAAELAKAEQPVVARAPAARRRQPGTIVPPMQPLEPMRAQGVHPPLAPLRPSRPLPPMQPLSALP